MLENIQQSIKYRNDEALKAQSSNSRVDKVMKANKQGIVTDTFINNKESENSIFKDTPMPDDLEKIYKKSDQFTEQKDKSAEKQFLAMIGVPLGVLGAITVTTGIMARVFKRKLNPEAVGKDGALSKIVRGIRNLFTDTEKGPLIPRQLNINTETGFVTYEALRDPSLKNLLGATAVFSFSSAAFVLKNTVDGLKDIWVKQNEADIKRDFQEKMIDIETRSFSGKKQTVRYLLDTKTKELDSINKSRNIFFAGNKREEPENKDSESGINPAYILAGIAAIGTSVFLIRKTLKNIREIGKLIKESTSKLDEQEGKKTGSSWASAHTMYGDPSGKPTVFGFLNDASGHVYNMFINPGQFTGLLAAGMSAIAGIAYAGSKFVEGNREIQVKKANARINLDMHDKLVPVELKNFLEKKEVAVSPLIDDYKTYSQSHSEDIEGLKSKYSGIMNEIKNGPPFIYD